MSSLCPKRPGRLARTLCCRLPPICGPRLIPVIVLLLLLPTVALAALPMIKVQMGSQGKVWVGQKTVVIIKLYSPTYFTGTPRFDLPEVPGLVMMKVPGRPVVGSEQVGDAIYSVQRHEFFVYSQRTGKVTIPPFSVQFGVAGVGMARPFRHVLETRQLQFVARMPAGAEHLQTLISAHELEVREFWRSKPDEPVVGDAFTRTISFRAPDIPGMAFPPIPSMEVPGLAIYPAPARVDDKVERGDLTGERVETITYVCEKPGKVTIPALVFHWWDLSAERMRRVEFPAVQLNVAPDHDLAKPAVTTPPPYEGSRDFLDLLIAYGVSLPALSLLLVLFFFRRRITLALRHRRQRRAASEACAFAQLLRACRHRDPAMVLKAFWNWMDRLPPGYRVVTLGDFVRRFPQPQLAVELQCLEQAVLNSRSDWNGAALARCLKMVRKTMLAERNRALTQPLPDLNPRHY